MSLFAVARIAGPGWAEGSGAFDQPGVNEHAAFMSHLADEGFVLYAGPLAGSETGRIRALVIIDADSAGEIRRRLADDPWTLDDHLVTTTIEPWVLFVGAERLAGAAKP
ncbi:MAG: hypothetical protein ABWZ15_01585 [Acidimicrobiia bacterium]